MNLAIQTYHRDDVFIAGGQPTVTYVERKNQHVELNLARAIATPNQIVSIAGPSKTGKTVLCRKVLGEREYVWIDGGKISSAADFWEHVANEFKLSDSVTLTNVSQVEGGIKGGLPLAITGNGSLLKSDAIAETRKINSSADAIDLLLREKIVLVIDDFHYLAPELRTEIMRNVKAPVYAGLKVVLLSVTHRAFDAITAERELTGRFSAVTLPNWSAGDLKQISTLGFKALNIKSESDFVEKLVEECQENPFLMQRFCWEVCFELKIEQTSHFTSHVIPPSYDLPNLFFRLSADAGLPIYQKLAAGPQSRKVRAKRPLKNGAKADIYEATLLALAETGPKAVVKYEELRTALSNLLEDMMPQKHEITSALKHLSTISQSADSALDWDENNREVNIVDPYLRFYLRWQIKKQNLPL